VASQIEPRRRRNFPEARWDRFRVACCAKKRALFSVMVDGVAICDQYEPRERPGTIGAQDEYRISKNLTVCVAPGTALYV
jgi:hypothetical protein